MPVEPCGSVEGKRGAMTVRLHFAGLCPGRPLVVIAWAAYARDPVIAGATAMHFGRELADTFERHWRVVSEIKDADVVIYPHPYEDGLETNAVAEAARAAGKPCLFYSQDERLPPSRLKYGTLYRSSIFRKQSHERSHPVFINDVRDEAAGSYPEVLEKTSRPSVGFCGYVGTPLTRMVWRLIGQRQKVDGLTLRARVLGRLQADHRVDGQFVARATYLGSATLSVFDAKHPLVDERKVFLANLFGNAYGLAMRGKGNHSVRFYEILCAGRIPLFVNTGCTLPLENAIDWRTHTCWVEDADLERIGEAVVTFHERITPDAFLDLQRRNRRLWEERLRPEPYFRYVLDRVAAGEPAP